MCLLSLVLLYIHVYCLMYVVMISCTHDKSEMTLRKTLLKYTYISHTHSEQNSANSPHSVLRQE